MTGLYNAKYHILAILTVAVWGTHLYLQKF